MNHKHGYFDGLGGLKLYYQGWLPAQEPRALLLVSHGMAEHSGRYGNVVNHFVPKGYAVYALDHRGHGLSEGQRVYVERFHYFLDDLKTFFDLVRDWNPRLKIFLIGHSMGGGIALACALRHQDELDGLILSGAAIQSNSGISPLLLWAGKLLSALAPRLGVLKLDGSAISRDPAVVQAYNNDSLVYNGKVTARLGDEMLSRMSKFPKQMPYICLPLLVLHGSADRLTDPAGSHMLYERAESTDKTLKIYDGHYHEVFNDLDKEQVLADLQSWLAERL